MESELPTLSLIDASISELQQALTLGWTTSVELVARYLRRISVYDASGLTLSATPILNPSVFEEAEASDARTAAGLPPRPLEGIPYLVKDSIKVKGMTVACGSPAFEGLIATEDAACVKILRDAGAVLLGRTNMPAMAYGGMQRGSYGRSESPYNMEYLTAAYGSGSSNGSATATAANFCAFSLGTETVSSGRSPASNNSIIAYTPSKGLLPLRGVWPLYPTCDVLVPHTRTMSDLFQVLDVLAVADKDNEGDFWNEQKFISLPSVDSIRPQHFKELEKGSSLRGKRLGIPSMFINSKDPLQNKIRTRPSIIKLWDSAKLALESCGATVVEVDFPLLATYEANISRNQLVNIKDLPENWPAKERCELVAHAWDNFLVTNAQQGLESLACVDPDDIFPLAPGSLRGAALPANQLQWKQIVQYATAKPKSIFEIPGMEQALNALENARKETLEEWMDQEGLDAIVFPANADIGRANADVDPESSRFAWENGVKYSNGNQAIRHLGVPTISVPMGLMKDTNVPVNLTFAGKAYEDNKLLEFAYAFEKITKHRSVPPLVPALDSDSISMSPDGVRSNGVNQTGTGQIKVQAQSKEVLDSTVFVKIQGTLEITENAKMKRLSCYVNGTPVEVTVEGSRWSLATTYPKSSWGNLSPYAHAPGFGLPKGAPQGCELAQVHILHRHAKRYPTDFVVDAGSMDVFASALRNASKRYPDTDIGGFCANTGGNSSYPQHDLVIIPENSGFNNTLSPTETCAKGLVIGEYKAVGFIPAMITTAAEHFAAFLPDDFFSKETEIAAEEDLGMFNLCPYGYAMLGSSSFCLLFTEQEWRDFEYYLDLQFNNMYGFGSPSGRAQGISYVQELAARLQHRLNKSSESSINSTYDGNKKDFPLEQPLFMYISHDKTIISVLTALGLDYFNYSPQGMPSTVTHAAKRHFKLNEMTPFAAHLFSEVWTCPESTTTSFDDLKPQMYKNPDLSSKYDINTEQYIRFLLNNSPLPLDGLPACDRSVNELCSLKNFLSQVPQLTREAMYQEACFGD
ncbi:amidase signature domain-containing protein [Aspergillus spectabilis]